jgi:hypothetical protein
MRGLWWAGAQYFGDTSGMTPNILVIVVYDAAHSFNISRVGLIPILIPL